MSNQIQNKLFHYEVQPPEGAWTRLTAFLDDRALGEVGTKLSQAEVLPDPKIWNKINEQLDETRPAKVVPFYKRYSRPIKYGSAVAVFAFIALVTNLLISKKTVSEAPVLPIVKKQLTLPGGQKQNSFPIVTDTNYREVILAEVTSFESNHKNHIQVKRRASQLRPTLLGITSSTGNLVPKIATRNTIIAFSDDADKYMAYSMEDGNAVKLPKKMFDALTCPTKDISCLQKIRQIQEKIAASALFADFTGVLDILNNLGENQ